MMTDWESVCRKVHEAGVEMLQEHGRTPFCLEIYPSDGENCVTTLSPDGLTDEIRERLGYLHVLLRLMKPAAVLISSDVWQAGDKFWNHYGLQSAPFEERNKRYLEILKREYKGSLENVPDELKGEALVTHVKGPKFLPISITTLYHREGGKVIVDRTTDPKRHHGQMNVVPDWWESVIQ